MVQRELLLDGVPSTTACQYHKQSKSLTIFLPTAFAIAAVVSALKASTRIAKFATALCLLRVQIGQLNRRHRKTHFRRSHYSARQSEPSFDCTAGLQDLSDGIDDRLRVINFDVVMGVRYRLV